MLFGVCFCADDEDAFMLVPEIIAKYGYPVEEHFVTTADGYIVNLHRIPYGKDGVSENRPAVLVMHGVSSSSADFIIAGPDKALGYVLADAGYDVWLGNSRGNRYSRNHTYLSPDTDKKKFWDFSFHQLAVFDLPAMIDHITATTAQEKIFYVGHSQGTTIFYVLCSEKPEYNDRFRAHFSLSPVVYMHNLDSVPFQTMSWYHKQLEYFVNLYGAYEYGNVNDPSHAASQQYCNSTNVIHQEYCKTLIFMNSGYNEDQFNYTLLPITMGHTPAGISMFQVIHFFQECRSDHFRQYDYGLTENMVVYGQANPPDYNLANVVAPVYLFYSKNDYLSNEKDVLRLNSELPNVKALMLMSDPLWTHLDYLWGIDAKTIVYQPLIDLMNAN